MTLSLAEQLALTPDRGAAFYAGLSTQQLDALLADWQFWGRPEQFEPDGVWGVWGVAAGRGYGKNRTGSEWCCDRAEQFAGHRHPHRCALLNRSLDHVHRLQVGGESGIAAVAERRGHRLHLPRNTPEGTLQVWDEGWQTSELVTHTADDPDRVRGENLHTMWADEVASWRHRVDAEGQTAFTNAQMGLRSTCPPGLQPRAIVTTTPKPIALIRDLLAGRLGPTVLSRGTTWDNRANLADQFIADMYGRYGGTRLGAQELGGLLLDAVEGALWSPALIARGRRTPGMHPMPERFDLIVVGVDPPAETMNAECGIVVVGVAPEPRTRREVWVLDDRSETAEPGNPLTPGRWAKAVVGAARAWQDRGPVTVVAERNNGGEMVRHTIHGEDDSLRVETVWASDNKRTRAEPVASLYDQTRVRHWGEFPELEAQQTTWVPGEDSPDRMDALVWAATQTFPLVHTRAVELGAAPVVPATYTPG